MSKKVFSVVTVCLNSQNTIEKTIKSVLLQQEYVQDYVIVDGLSKDLTLDIIKKYESRFKASNILLTVISEKDNGIYDAMNKGIERSNGKIISLINSDDWYENNALSETFQFFRENSHVQIAHGNLNYHCKGKIIKHIPKQKSNFFWFGMTLNHPTFFVKKNIYKKIKFDPSYKVAGDYDFLLKTMSIKIQYGYLNKTLINFSCGGASSFIFNSIKELHRAKINNGFSFFKTWLSTFFLVFLTVTSFLKNFFIKS